MTNTQTPPTTYYALDDDGRETSDALAWSHPASPDAVRTVLGADENSDDGRSAWTWFRLANGDLILGVFPQGDTYFEVEYDGETP